MKITIEDINRRFRSRNSKAPKDVANLSEVRLFTDDGIFCTNNAISALSNWRAFDEDSNIAFDKAMDIFEIVCENCNESLISTETSFLTEAVDKVRDASQLLRSLKIRNSRLNKKSATKANKAIELTNNTIKNSISDLNRTVNKSDVLASMPSGVASESFNAIYNTALKAASCDRILETYNSISRRFNLENIISDANSTLYENAIRITKAIDTYNSPMINKYNAALETVYYLFNKNHFDFDNASIVEAVTDYFLFSGSINEENIADLKYIRRTSVLFEQEDFDIIDRIVDPPISSIDQFDPEADNYGITLYEDANFIKQGLKDLKKDAKKGNKLLRKAAKEGIEEGKDKSNKEVEKMLDEFRKDCVKDKNNKSNPSKFKAIITRIFTKSPEEITEELPNIFSIIRAFFIVNGAFIHPICGLVTLIADQCTKITLERKQLDKIIKSYKAEIMRIDKKIDSAKDKTTKDNLTKYRKELEKDLEKIERYENNIYTDEENDEKDEKREKEDDKSGYSSRGSSSSSDDDDDWDLDDDWDDFEESVINPMASIVYISELMTSLSESTIDDNVDGVVFDNIYKFSPDALDTLADFVVTVPVILEKDCVKEAMINLRKELRDSKIMTAETYIKIDCLNNNIDKINKSNRPLKEDNLTIDESIYALSLLNEMVNSKSEYITEMNFTNTIKLALNNLKRKAIKLSDKEKSICNSIDAAASNVANKIEKEMMNGRREAVIKGSIRPSASKCIKLALATGAAWAVNPAIAVIGAIGALACQKKMSDKERQLVLDDIEIELKMTERYIRQAEDKNDMKALRQLEIIQRNLQRQQQRIKLKQRVYFKGKTELPSNSDED